MKRYILLTLLSAFAFAGNNNSSFYVIKDGNVYTATEAEPCVPVKYVSRMDYATQSRLMTILFESGEKNSINDVLYDSRWYHNDNYVVPKAHYEIVNTMSEEELKKSLGIDPDKKDCWLCRRNSVYCEDIPAYTVTTDPNNGGKYYLGKGFLSTNDDSDEYGMIHNTEVGTWHAKVSESFRLLRWRFYAIRFPTKLKDY